MDETTAKLIETVPTMAVLIYLLYKEGQKTERLLAELLAQSKEHASNLVQMAIAGISRRQEDLQDK